MDGLRDEAPQNLGAAPGYQPETSESRFIETNNSLYIYIPIGTYQRGGLVRNRLVNELSNQYVHPLHHPQANVPSEHSNRNGLVTGGLVGQVINQG